MGSVNVFGLYVRLPFVAYGLLELLICIASVHVAVYLRFSGDYVNIAESFHSPMTMSMVFGVVMSASLMALGLYQSNFRGGSVGILLRIALGFAAGSAGLALLFYVLPELYLGRGATGIAVLLSFAGIALVRPALMPLLELEGLKRRVLVLGVGKQAATIGRRLRRRADRRGFQIVGYVSHSGEACLVCDGVVVVSLKQSLHDYCRENGIDQIVVAHDEQRRQVPVEDLVECRLAGIDVIELHTFFEREAGFLPINLIKPSWFIYAEGFRSGRLRDGSKRVFDVLISLAILLLCWPFILLTVLAIRLEDGWDQPVLYRQQRVGLYGQVFSILKFRSMRVDAEKDGIAQWAAENDVRVTRVGGWIRRLRIDELPQLLNVLRGDMSFVGPRPERPAFVESLSTQIPYYRERHQVKPGITGWAQVCYPYGASDEDAGCKHEFDLFYVKNHTFFLDLLILFQTVEVVLLGKGVR